MTMNGRRSVHHHPQRDPWLSNLFSFIHLRTLCPQWTTPNSFTSNHFRTLSHSTAGGVSLSRLISRRFFIPLAASFEGSFDRPFTTCHALLFSVSYELPNLQPFCFYNVATVGGWGVPVRSNMPKWEGGENHIV
jgi:hypothetical protein